MVAFIDDDDEWLPDKLEIQLRFMRERSARLTFSRVLLIDEQGGALAEERPMYPESFTWPGILFRNPVHSPSSVLMEREAFLATGGFPEAHRMGEDWVLWARAARLGGVAFLDRPLARYRVHAQQAAAGHDDTWTRERTLEALGELARELPPAQRDLVLASYAYGGAWRALAARRFRAARRLASAGGGVDWRLLLRRGITGGLAQLLPGLSSTLDRRELTRLVRAFEALQ
jgi:hypothetical protein